LNQYAHGKSDIPDPSKKRGNFSNRKKTRVAK
jgi:hypothetical protein